MSDGTNLEALKAATRRALALDPGVELKLEAILRGGSDRHFYRIRTVSGACCILVEYGTERPENALYADLAEFLQGLGVAVPALRAREDAARRIWLEDLGSEDLHARRNDPWEPRRDLYQQALEQVSLMHRHGLAAAERGGIKLMPGFDEKLYAWERAYFYNEFVRGACGLEWPETALAELEAALARRAAVLAREATALVHRDFQSQNIMLKEGRPYLIDFQGMRRGVLHYDLASLLMDPYVNLSGAEQEELLKFYFSLGVVVESYEAFHESYLAAGMQRIMQALGAYGFLGLKKGKPAFLKHIPRALLHLETVAGRAGAPPLLAELIAACAERSRDRFEPLPHEGS